MSTVVTDIRCPSGATSLLGKMVFTQGEPTKQDGVLLEFHCKECTKDFRRIRGKDTVLRVLHLYHTNAEFVSTKIQFRDGAEKDIDLETQVEMFRLSTMFRRGL